jgi:RNA polymerase sigma factor (sigma-70 family)
MGQTALAETQTAPAETHVGALDDAFERLYREHAPTVYRYALGVLRNPADAEDVAQSTFTNAYRAVRGGEWPSKPENWLITIAHNECRQRFRRQGRRAIEVPFDEEVVERSQFDDPAETAEEVEGVLNALAELPFNQRAAIVLREVSGRSAAEIAEFLGTSVNAVDMLLFRARRTLRTHYSAVKTLALVPLPRSLFSFGGGSAAAKAGAVAGGLGIAGKVGAVLAAGAVAAGGGYTGLQVKEHRESPAPPEQRLEARKSPSPAAPETRPASASPRGGVAGSQTPGATVEPVQIPPSIAPAAAGPEAPFTGAEAPSAPVLGAPVAEPAEPPTSIPSVPSPPAVQPPALPPVAPPPALPPVAPLPPVQVPPAPPAVEPPPVSLPPLPSLPVEPPAVTVPPLPEIPTEPVSLPVP